LSVPALSREQREQRRRELRERFPDESEFWGSGGSAPSRLASGTSRPGGDVGSPAAPALEASEADAIVIPADVQSLLDAKPLPGRRYPTPELRAEAKRLAQHIGSYRYKARRLAGEGDRERFELAVGHLRTLLAKREALLAQVASERGAQPSPAAVEAPDRGRDVRLRITGVWTGQTLSELLHGLARTVATDGLRWRAQVEISPEEAAP